MKRVNWSITFSIAACMLVAPAAFAQYQSDFDGLMASADGTVLTGQDGYYLPNATSTDFEAYSYSANTLRLPQNPTGGTQFIAGVLSASLPVIFEPLLPTPQTLRGIVFARPFERRILRDWLRTYEVNDRRRIMDEIRQGLVFDETPSQIGRRIFGTAALGGTDGVREITRRGAQTLAQTSMSAITNAARSALYARNRSIRREVYVATLDARTTPICQSLDGDVFPKNEGPFPPLHLNCRSLRAPVVDGRKLGRRPASAATERELRGLRGPARRRAVEKLVGPVPAETTYTDFLRRQKVSFQDEVLGPARGRLFRSGELDLKGFVDNSGQRITLRNLYERDPGVFQRAGVATPPAPGALVPRNP